MGPPCPRRALGTAASREGLGQGQGPGGQRALGQVRALPWTQRGKHRECGGSRSTACAPFQHPPSGAGSKPAGSRAEAGGWSRRPGRWHTAPRLRSAPRLRWVTSQPVPGALSWPGRAQCSRLCFFQPRSAAAAPHSWLPAGVPLGRGRARGGWQGAEAPRPSPSARCPEAGRPTLQRPWVRPPAGSGSRSPPGQSSVQGRFALAPLLFEAEVPRGRGEPVLLLPTTAATRACVVSEQRLPHQPCCLPPSREGSGWGGGAAFGSGTHSAVQLGPTEPEQLGADVPRARPCPAEGRFALGATGAPFSATSALIATLLGFSAGPGGAWWPGSGPRAPLAAYTWL